MSRDRLYGIGEPLTSRGLHGDLDPMVGLELMDAMGCTAFREWMHIPDILSDPSPLSRKQWRRIPVH